MIHIKGVYEGKEAKLIRAGGDKDTVLCDKNNFCYYDFKGKEVKLEGKDKLSCYLFNKAIDMGAEGKKVKLPEGE